MMDKYIDKKLLVTLLVFAVARSAIKAASAKVSVPVVSAVIAEA